ncbi:MAG TPA: hypothetical protein VIQ01_02415, partial [Burkholderiales bacterium]
LVLSASLRAVESWTAQGEDRSTFDWRGTNGRNGLKRLNQRFLKRQTPATALINYLNVLRAA